MDGFDEFWAIYPRRVAKLDAARAFAKALKFTTLDKLLAGARRYAAEKYGDRYIKHPATWLNGGCWDDEPPPPHRNGGPIDGREKRLQDRNRRLNDWEDTLARARAYAAGSTDSGGDGGASFETVLPPERHRP
jgi:hypothetical protein